MHRDQRRSTGEPAAAIDGGDREEEGLVASGALALRATVTARTLLPDRAG